MAQGTQNSLNTTISALNGFVYQPDADYAGPDTLSIRIADNGNSGDGGPQEGTGSVGITVRVQPAVLGRHVFYNQSFFDGNGAAANAADDGAIAPDKSALRAGSKATFSNDTSYHQGLNGMMVDIEGLPGEPTAADFTFRMGNNQSPPSWGAGPTPASVTVRRGAGVGGSDRITLTWAADAVKKKWLQVTVLATAATGLSQPDVFYFGNAVGETGNSLTDARVTSVDALRVLANVTSSASITNPFDINRHGRVGAGDRLTVLGNLSALEPLVLLDLSGGPALLGVRGSLESTPVPVAAQFHRVASGVAVRWVADGSTVRIWTSEALVAADWEIYGEVGADVQPGEVIEFVFPTDTDGAARFYRLEAIR